MNKTFNAQQFIEQVWQQQPLLIKAALPEVAGIIDGDDLAGIACEAEGEARLIVSNAEQTDWQCEQGPFTAKRFTKLPASHWTLLVQSVDQWIPEIQALLAHFDFLPRWRLDDIMISYATNGGGVGPHFDYYDVFLLQASGKRRWQVGQRCDENSPLRDNEKIKLLQEFHAEQDYTLSTGDMLYLPAGVAHWGTAVGDDCITISIGFRAASHKEIVQAALENIAETLPNNQRYRDTQTSIDNDAFHINNSAVDNLMAIWKTLSEDDVRTALVQALGELATEPRNADREEPEKTLDEKQLVKKLAAKNGLAVEHHPASRFAWHRLDDENADLYVDGGMLCTTPALAQAICHGRITKEACNSDYDRELLLALLNQGSLIPL
ncbi:MAG TPA: cupin domain-containing protein [Pseudomonadales bacterium]|nr:cupin domain-containing protein [Pseudomonadales bacterium]